MPEKQRGEPAAVLYTAPPHVRDARGNALLQPEARLSLSPSAAPRLAIRAENGGGARARAQDPTEAAKDDLGAVQMDRDAKRRRYVLEGTNRYSNMQDSSDLAAFATVATGVTLSSALVYPADIARSLKAGSVLDAEAGKMTAREMLAAFRAMHGPLSVFSQGLNAELARTLFMLVFRFFAFPVVHEELTGVPPYSGNPATKAIAGALCTLPESIFVVPFEVAKVALHFDRANAFNNSISAVMRHSYETGGVGALYAGWAPTVAKKAIWAGGYFGSLGFFQKNARAALRSARELAGSSSEETLNQIRVAQVREPTARAPRSRAPERDG